jgi:large subunit ribosomal protein L17
MRHGKKVNHLGRTSSHRKALLSNLATALIMNKRINTTLAKAKELKKYVEPLITKSKADSTASRRDVFSYLQDKYSTAELFKTIAPKIADRPGGYTRIIKTGFRMGDAAETCMMELVDFNDLLVKDTKGGTAKKAKTTRRGAAKKKVAPKAKTKPEADAETKKEDEAE